MKITREREEIRVNQVITIGRQYGSGGRLIGKRVAEELQIPYYDNELLSEAAKSSGISEELFKSNDEMPTTSLLYSLVVGSMPAQMPLQHRLFLAQFDTIRAIAGRGPCLIVGRCADYALREYENTLSVFIHASLESRIRRATSEYGVPEKKAGETILKYDRKRASYYNYYSNRKWGAASSYDVTLDSGKFGVENCVEIIVRMARM